MAAPLLCTYSAWIRRPSNRESVVCLRDALATGKPPQPPPLRNALRTAHDPFCIFRCAGANATATNCGTQCHSALLDVPAACRNTFGTLSAPWCDLQHISKTPSACPALAGQTFHGPRTNHIAFVGNDASCHRGFALEASPIHVAAAAAVFARICNLRP